MNHLRASSIQNRASSIEYPESFLLPLESCVLSLVSCFLYICRGSITFVVRALQISPFLTNKANFPDDQMNVTKVLTKDYENKTLSQSGKNKANSKPNKANFQKAGMNVNKVLTRDYENKSNWALFENKPNTNPIKPNTKPISKEFPNVEVEDPAFRGRNQTQFSAVRHPGEKIRAICEGPRLAGIQIRD